MNPTSTTSPSPLPAASDDSGDPALSAAAETDPTGELPAEDDYTGSGPTQLVGACSVVQPSFPRSAYAACGSSEFVNAALSGSEHWRRHVESYDGPIDPYYEDRD